MAQAAPVPPLDEQDREVARVSLAAELDAIRLIDDLLILINHGSAAMDGQRHDRGLNFVIALLTVRAFNSIWKARQAAVEGYPVQCFVLTRAALEDWVAVRWLEEKPGEKDLWLCRLLDEVPVPLDARGRERWIPSADDMLKDLPEGAVPLEAYKQLSRVAHPRGAGLGWQFHADTESSYVHAGPHFSAGDLRRCLYFLILTAAGFLSCVERLQVRWRGSADAIWVAGGIAAVKRASEYADAVGTEVRAAIEPVSDAP